MAAIEGWDNKSVKDHVETAKETGEYALDLAQQCADDIEKIKEQLSALDGEYNE